MTLAGINRIRFLERLADQVLQVFNLHSIPISLGRIIDSEGIIVGEGDFGPDFYGRLEYHPARRVFLLFHPIQNKVEFIRCPVLDRARTWSLLHANDTNGSQSP